MATGREEEVWEAGTRARWENTLPFIVTRRAREGPIVSGYILFPRKPSFLEVEDALISSLTRIIKCFMPQRATDFEHLLNKQQPLIKEKKREKGKGEEKPQSQ